MEEGHVHIIFHDDNNKPVDRNNFLFCMTIKERKKYLNWEKRALNNPGKTGWFYINGIFMAEVQIND